MKKNLRFVLKVITTCFLFVSLAQLNSQAQQICISIKGDTTNRAFTEVQFGSYGPYVADTSEIEIVSEAWTCNSQGYPTCNFRALLKYDLSSIPSNAVVSSAKLYLYAKTDAVNGLYGSPTYGTANTSLFQKITSAWNISGLGWANQPSTDTTTQKTLAQSTNPTENYVVDITDFAQGWINSPSTNYGALLRLKNEDYYNSMIFNSGRAADSLQPTLVICYSIPNPNDTCVSIKGDTANHAFHEAQLGLYSDGGVNTGNYGADTSEIEIVSEAWTCNGQGYPTCNFRALLKYDLSFIPSNASVSSAKLYLYAKTDAINGLYGSPTYGTNNTSLFQKATSSWSPSSITWNSQPSVDTLTQKILAQSTNATENYVVDITDFAQGWVSNPSTNYGALLRLQNEAYYNSMIFNSGRAPDSLKPTLVICYSKAVLALALQNFEAVPVKDAVKLSWSILDGASLSSILVERSLDGISFNGVGTVEVKNTTQQSNYVFVDNNRPLSGTAVYYRLRLMNSDGSYTTSNVLMVKLPQDDILKFQITPNPVASSLKLVLNAPGAGKAEFSIINVLGQTVGRFTLQTQKGANVISAAPTQNIASGVYMLRVIMNGQIISQKFVKE